MWNLLLLLSCTQPSDTLPAPIKDSVPVVSMNDSLQLVSQDTAIETIVDVPSRYPTGSAGWYRYLTQAAGKYLYVLQKDSASNGTCRISFVVEPDGTVTHVQALTMQNTLLAKILMDAVARSLWYPAQRFGKPVRTRQVQAYTSNLLTPSTDD